ncbi:MAG: glycine--tRNA ligase subunit beta, partial [Pantoea sp.]|uniref:glycine--tRNA ligase subunit beta n=1 Tax=Pantoea sp. TaxID=69393 RepID=UPI0039E6CAFD
VDADERRERIVGDVEAAAQEAGGGQPGFEARISDDNLQQVACLTEWPSAVLCSFDKNFLGVPQEALIETMEVNQKFFPVLKGGKLTEHFIGIANIESKNVIEVRKGYERVIRPRFSDAKFFFDEDLKQGLAPMGEGLAGVTYQAKLGSIADKVQRVANLAETIAREIGEDPALARHAAQLAKNDLQSRMVGEFPELQGIAGRHYALAAGEPESVAIAIDESYAPRFAGDDIALTPLGKILAIAERLDTLAGGFAAGLKPTGNKDPFALRRNALGLARTIIESGWHLDCKQLLVQAVRNAVQAIENTGSARNHAEPTGKTLLSALGGDKSYTLEMLAQAAEIYDFVLDRLRGYYADRGVPAAHFNAVAELKPASLYDFDTRIDAIGDFAELPEAAALAAANKRINNILKKADVAIPPGIDRALLKDPVESALAEAVQAALGDTDEALARRDYVRVLGRLARLRAQVDNFFDSVMVNADDPAVRGNRLALLKKLADRFGAVAAIEHLSA